LTGGTSILAVFTLFLFGGDTLRGFSFVMLVGIITGTYSSIFIASPWVLLWERLLGREPRQATEGARSGRESKNVAAVAKR
jgi:preprotein translocase subunit SecF